MFSRDGSLRASSFSLLPGATALGAAFALFSAAAGVSLIGSAISDSISDSFLNAKKPGVVLPVQGFQWLKEVHVGLESAPTRLVADVAVPNIPQVQVAVHHAAHPHAPHTLVVANHHPIHRSAAKVHLASLDRASSESVTTQTRLGAVEVPAQSSAFYKEAPLHIQAAHPEAAPATLPAASPATSNDIQLESQKLRGIHDFLRGKFQVAMGESPAMDIQVAAAVTPKTEASAAMDTQVALIAQTAKVRHHAKKKQMPLAKDLVAYQTPSTHQTQPSARLLETAPVVIQTVTFPPNSPARAPIETETVQQLVDTVLTHSAAPIEVEAVAADSDPVAEDITADHQDQSGPPADEAMAAPAAPESAPLEGGASAATIQGGQPVAAAPADYSKAADYSVAEMKMPEGHLPPMPGAREQEEHANTQPAAIPQNALKTTQDNDTTIAMTAAPLSLTPDALFASGLSAPSYVEAFNWGATLDGASTSQLTNEGPGIGWRTAQAPDHWPTMHWSSDRSVPLVGNSSAAILAHRNGSSLQAGAGIVIVKVAAGWGAEFSGRAERPMVFDSKNQLISTGQLDGERYFAFLNAAPGAGLVYITRGAGFDGGAIAIPVQSGYTTYADATLMSRHPLSGKVLDGEASSTHGLSHIEVRVVGQSQATALSSTTGAFRIESVTTFADHPIFVETEAATGYTHRYKLKQTQMHSATLFRLSEAQVQESIGQLEGGISPESGMIVAAMPESVLSKNVEASVRSMAPNPTLRPETYSMAPNGQLSPQHKLSSDISRFLSLQLPEGPAIAAAETADNTHKQVWSELLFVSPGVVDLVMPQ